MAFSDMDPDKRNPFGWRDIQIMFWFAVFFLCSLFMGLSK